MLHTGSWWRVKGFAEAPRYEISRGDEVVYRIHGGPARRIGAFFMPLTASCMIESELRANIMTWETRCLFRSTFRLHPDVGLWIGPVTHASRDIAGRWAQQIYILRPDVSMQRVDDVEALRRSFHVVQGSGHGSVVHGGFA